MKPLLDKSSVAFSDAPIAPIERTSIAEQVAKHLLELIRTGRFEAGQQLPPERELALSLQVSRPSVREALRGLQILGAIRMRQGGGVYVSDLSAAEMLQPLQVFLTLSGENFEALHEARLQIEGGIGRLIAARAKESDVERLRSLVEAQRKLIEDPVAFRVSDMEFHRILRETAGNPFLDRVSASFYVLGSEYRRVRWDTPGMLSQSVKDHDDIVQALASRNEERVVIAMQNHMHSVHRSTRAEMDEVLPSSAA